MLVMRRIGNAKPELVMAAVMRSRDSLIVPSGRLTMVRCFQTAQLSPTAMGCSTALLLHLDGVRMNAEHKFSGASAKPSAVAEKVLASIGAEFPGER